MHMMIKFACAPPFGIVSAQKGSCALRHPVPELNRKQSYEDFTRVLWHSYKDLMQKAAKMMEPQIGFLFKKDPHFETGLPRGIRSGLALRGQSAIICASSASTGKTT
jgi:hypothetical protein